MRWSSRYSGLWAISDTISSLRRPYRVVVSFDTVVVVVVVVVLGRIGMFARSSWILVLIFILTSWSVNISIRWVAIITCSAASIFIVGLQQNLLIVTTILLRLLYRLLIRWDLRPVHLRMFIVLQRWRWVVFVLATWRQGAQSVVLGLLDQDRLTHVVIDVNCYQIFQFWLCFVGLNVVDLGRWSYQSRHIDGFDLRPLVCLQS